MIMFVLKTPDHLTIKNDLILEGGPLSESAMSIPTSPTVEVLSKFLKSNAAIEYKRSKTNSSVHFLTVCCATTVFVAFTNRIDAIKFVIPLVGALEMSTFLYKKMLTENNYFYQVRKLLEHNIRYPNNPLYGNEESENYICASCYYYSSESQNAGVPYAQCTVNPSMVNTKASNSCVDYEINPESQLSE